MIGQVFTTTGRLVDNKELMLVHIELPKGGKVPAHDHVGQEVYFTPVRGQLELTLDGQEQHIVTPGQVLHFAGEASIGVEALEESEFFVYLINRQ